MNDVGIRRKLGSGGKGSDDRVSDSGQRIAIRYGYKYVSEIVAT